jgi:hypothetical protein
MAKIPLIIATNEAIKVTKGWKLAMLSKALEMLTIVAESARVWFVIFYLRL